jgi:hypothetical protein
MTTKKAKTKQKQIPSGMTTKKASKANANAPLK